jgi:hypothetical protein
MSNNAFQVTVKIILWPFQMLNKLRKIYMRYMEKEAEKSKQIELKRQRQEDKKQQEIEAKKQTVREERHKILLVTMEDDFNVLTQDLSLYLSNLEPYEIEAMIEGATVENQQYNINGGAASIGSAIGRNAVLGVKRSNAQSKIRAGGNHTITRTIADFEEKEKGILRLLSFFNLLGLITDEYYDFIQLSIIYNGGMSSFVIKANKNGEPRKKPTDSENIIYFAITNWLKEAIGPSRVSVNEAIATIGRVRQQVKDPKLIAIIDQELKHGDSWLRSG